MVLLFNKSGSIEEDSESKNSDYLILPLKNDLYLDGNIGANDVFNAKSFNINNGIVNFAKFTRKVSVKIRRK